MNEIEDYAKKVQTVILDKTDWEFFLEILKAPPQINQDFQKAVKNFLFSFNNISTRDNVNELDNAADNSFRTQNV